MIGNEIYHAPESTNFDDLPEYWQDRIYEMQKTSYEYELRYIRTRAELNKLRKQIANV